MVAIVNSKPSCHRRNQNNVVRIDRSDRQLVKKNAMLLYPPCVTFLDMDPPCSF